MSGNLPTPMDVEDPQKTPKVSRIEELDTQREEFRKDSESLTLEQLQRKAEMLEDKAAKATAKATFARAYYENEKKLIEKRQTAHQQRKKKLEGEMLYHKYVVHVLAERQGEGPQMIPNPPEAYVRYCQAYMEDNRNWVDDLVNWIATEQPARLAPPAAPPPLTRWERWSRWMSRVPAMRNKRNTRLMMDESLETWERNDLVRRDFEEKEGPTTRPYNPKNAEKHRNS